MHWFATETLGGDLASIECHELDHLHRVGHWREHRGAIWKEREQLDHESVGHAHERGLVQVRRCIG